MALRPDCPVLSKGTRVVRQVEDGKTSWIVRAGSTGRYLRMGESEAVLLELMDGKRTVEEVRVGWVARRRENLDPADVRSFLVNMRKAQVVDPTDIGRNLLLLEKARQKRKERLFAGGIGSLLYLRVKLLDPDRFLNAVEPWTRWMFTRAFVVAGSLLVLGAFAVLVSRFGEIASHLKDFSFLATAAGGVLGLWLTALSIVAMHETAHGVACKHWGGEVKEVGFLLLMFNPCFYCNVTDAYTFESRASRIWVTAAGGVSELLLGSVCVFLWVASEPGTALHSFTFVVFMISLSGTLVFNMNPLVKMDGYYIFADFVRVENLRERSWKHLKWILNRKILGRPAAEVAQDAREARILAAYGIASGIYMTLLITTLTALLVGVMLGGAGVGPMQVLLLGTVLWLMLRGPIVAAGGAVKDMVRTQVQRHGARRVWAVAGGGAAAAALIACFVPWTRAASGDAVAEPARTAELRAPFEGVVAEVLAGEGARVAAGQPVFRVDSPVEEATARAARETAERMRRQAYRPRDPGDGGASAARKEAEAASLRAVEAERRFAARLVASPFDGVVLTRHAVEKTGAPVTRDDPVVRVGDLSSVRFRASMDARSVGRIREGMDAVVMLRAFPGEEVEGKVASVARSPNDEKAAPGAPPPEPLWEVVVEAPNPDGRVRPGMTGELKVLYERTSVAGAVVKSVAETFRRDLFK